MQSKQGSFGFQVYIQSATMKGTGIGPLVVKFLVPPDTQQLPVLQAVQAVPVQPVPVQPMLPGLKGYRDLARESA